MHRGFVFDNLQPVKQSTPDHFAKLDAELILLAAESTGLRSTGRFQQLNSMENRVYAVEIEDAAQARGVGQIILKFYRPERWTPAMLVSEHALLRLLSEENIETPKLIPIQNADFIHPEAGSLRSKLRGEVSSSFPQTATLGKIDGFCFAVWQKVMGRVPLELEEKDLLGIGRTVARMHNLFERNIDPQQFVRARFSLDMYVHTPLQNLNQWNRVPRQFQSPLFDLIERIGRGLEWLPHADKYIPVHGDLHRLNLVQTTEGGQFWFVDFDDCQLGFAMQDLWPLASTCGINVPEHILLAEDLHPAQYALRLLCEGYREFRALPQDWEIFVEPLRTLKMIHYLGWIAGRWSDPFFRQTFAFFDDVDYWEKTYFDLNDQFEVLLRQGCLE
ncbi:serine/threonine protein kinase [bacterium]|nr:serine/threonine protein kinase [bacterium]